MLTSIVIRYSILIERRLFLFVGDVHAHQGKWIGLSTTIVHGRAARDFTSSSGCEKMVKEPTYIDEDVLDLVPTDDPDLVGGRVVSPVGTSDHSAVFLDVELEQPIPPLVCRQEV